MNTNQTFIELMTLYHYTSGQGLFGIFNSKELHCSNVNFLNDPSERSYISEILKYVFSESSDAEEIYNTLFNKSYINAVIAPFEIFVGSFSKNGDSLSMWNYYSKGNGYALGINIDEIIDKNKKDENISIQKIELVYEKNKQVNEVMAFLLEAKTKCEEYRKINDKMKAQDLDEYEYHRLDRKGMNIIEDFNDKFYNLMLRYKHHAYEREEEVRLIISENESQQKTTRFKVSGGGVFIEYFPLKLQIEKNIKKVVVHPLNGLLNAEGVKAFIKSVNGDNASTEIKLSKIPFRVV